MTQNSRLLFIITPFKLSKIISDKIYLTYPEAYVKIRVRQIAQMRCIVDATRCTFAVRPFAGIPHSAPREKTRAHPCLSTRPDTLRIFSRTRLLATNAANATAATAARPFPLSRDVNALARSLDRSLGILQYPSPERLCLRDIRISPDC